jgi:hypothetical protein
MVEYDIAVDSALQVGDCYIGCKLCFAIGRLQRGGTKQAGKLQSSRHFHIGFKLCGKSDFDTSKFHGQQSVWLKLFNFNGVGTRTVSHQADA